MPGMPPSHSGTAVNDTANALNLPLASMVRALCRAANTDTDILYDVMLKAALMVDAAAHTYGMATFAQKPGERPHLRWVEGLDADEIAEAEAKVETVLGETEGGPGVEEGDRDICLILSAATAQREGAAIYGRFARPLTVRQAAGLGMLSEVARLAHAHAQLREELYKPARAHRHAEVSSATLPGMVFVSRSMTELTRSVERVKDSDSTVLITGESGTGKELVARAVHRLSRRAQAPFIPFNCTAAPAELIESLLFGHRKGAFTGAQADHEGLKRAAQRTPRRGDHRRGHRRAPELLLAGQRARAGRRDRAARALHGRGGLHPARRHQPAHQPRPRDGPPRRREEQFGAPRKHARRLRAARHHGDAAAQRLQRRARRRRARTRLAADALQEAEAARDQRQRFSPGRAAAGPPAARRPAVDVEVR